MKKIFATVFMLLPTFAIANIENSYSGHRIVAGGSNTLTDNYDGLGMSDYGTGFHFGYGYDFNKIAGINIDYDTAKFNAYNYTEELKTWKLNSDFGYAFVFDKWTLKPFGSAGLAFSNLDWEIYDPNSAKQKGTESLGVSLMVGFGVRIELHSGLLFELKLNGFNSNQEDLVRKTSFRQTSLSIGAKF